MYPIITIHLNLIHLFSTNHINETAQKVRTCTYYLNIFTYIHAKQRDIGKVVHNDD